MALEISFPAEEVTEGGFQCGGALNYNEAESSELVGDKEDNGELKE